MAKTYKVTVTDGWMSKLKTELRAWQTNPALYQIEGNILTTKSDNVIDVVIEAFYGKEHLCKVERI